MQQFLYPPGEERKSKEGLMYSAKIKYTVHNGGKANNKLYCDWKGIHHNKPSTILKLSLIGIVTLFYLDS